MDDQTEMGASKMDNLSCFTINYYCKTWNESRDFKVIILDKNNKFCYHMYIWSQFYICTSYLYLMDSSCNCSTDNVKDRPEVWRKLKNWLKFYLVVKIKNHPQETPHHACGIQSQLTLQMRRFLIKILAVAVEQTCHFFFTVLGFYITKIIFKNVFYIRRNAGLPIAFQKLDKTLPP